MIPAADLFIIKYKIPPAIPVEVPSAIGRRILPVIPAADLFIIKYRLPSAIRRRIPPALLRLSLPDSITGKPTGHCQEQ